MRGTGDGARGRESSSGRRPRSAHDDARRRRRKTRAAIGTSGSPTRRGSMGRAGHPDGGEDAVSPGRRRRAMRRRGTRASINTAGLDGAGSDAAVPSGRDAAARSLGDSYPVLRKTHDEENAATTIQTRFRSHSARKQCRRKKVWADKERHRTATKRHRDLEERGAATRLQAKYRGHLAQKEASARRKGRAMAQRQRSIEQRRKEARAREQAEQTVAATKLQTSFRGKLARERASGMKADRLHTEKARRRAEFDRKKRRRHAEREKQREAGRQDAACRVQAAYRGKLARRMYKKAQLELLMKSKTASRRAKSRAERRRRREESQGVGADGTGPAEDDAPATEERGANTECSMFRVRDAATSMNVDAATSTEPATCEVATQYDAGDQQKAAALSGKREAGGGGFGGRLGSPYGGPFGIAPAGGVFGDFGGGAGGAVSPSYLSSDSLASDDEELFSPVGRPSRSSSFRPRRSPHRRSPHSVNEAIHVLLSSSPGERHKRKPAYEPRVHSHLLR